MKVVVEEPMKLKSVFCHGANTYEIEQVHGHARVMVDGEQVGLAIVDAKDPYHDCLHPLSKGYPKEFLQMVVDNSNGRFKRFLNGPAPLPELEEDEDEFSEQVEIN